MRPDFLRRVAGLVGIFLLFAAMLAIGSQRSTASANDNPTPSSEQAVDEQLVVQFNLMNDPANNEPWTEERLAAAKPYPLVRMPGAPQVSTELAQPDGEPGMVPSSPPAGQESPGVDTSGTTIASVSALTGYQYPPPYMRYKNFDSYLEFPYSTVGVVFFRQYGIDYRCSAASIGENSIWTAGHCMHAGDGSGIAGRSTNIWFYPAYKDGNIPFGGWQASAAMTTTQWASGNCPFACEIRYDMGGAKLLPQQGSGDTLSEVVGSLGMQYNLPDPQHWFNIGYPALAPFNGKYQYICASSFAYRDTSLAPPSPIGMGCDMTPGSSGGPWILNFSGEAGATNFINGNNSYRYLRQEEMFSPYYGGAAKVLWDQLTP